MFCISSLIGDVVINDVRNSVTRESVDKYFRDTDVGVGITNMHQQVWHTPLHLLLIMD